MASVMGSNRRKAEAQARIESVMPRIIEQFGVDVEGMPSHRRDAHREGAERAEWLADVLEAIVESAPKASARRKKAEAA